MILDLVQLDPRTRGIYNSGNGPNTLPNRMLRLHPSAAASFAAMEADAPLIYTDIWRSAESSLRAFREKRGVLPPGFSAHNFGFALDVALEATMAMHAWDYRQLAAHLEKHGWYCHRRDLATTRSRAPERAFEAWHFNYLGPDGAETLTRVTDERPTTWKNAAEYAVSTAYGPQLALTDTEAQAALQQLGYYHGDVDGVVGPLTREALAAFRRAWNLPDKAPAYTVYRTLAFVEASSKLRR